MDAAINIKLTSADRAKIDAAADGEPTAWARDVLLRAAKRKIGMSPFPSRSDAMDEHTPGPWFDDGYRIHAPTGSADKRDGRVIVVYKHVDDFNEADAPLIAAAPEMYALLKELGFPFNADAGGFFCLLCGSNEAAGHHDDCRLAAVLKAIAPPIPAEITGE